MKCSREPKEPPGGRLGEHVGTHVFYRMMMMAAALSAEVIADH